MSATRNEHAKRPSATKSGPGRYHASAAKKLRRSQVALMGRRQYLKRQRAERLEALPTGLVEAA